MKYKKFFIVFIINFFFIGLYSLLDGQEVLEFGRFGKVRLYQGTAQPQQVVLFVSGDGGWNLGVVDMAKTIALEKSLVAGIDINYYLKQLANSNEKCSYPAADFEELSKFIQIKKKLPDYITPVLIGYSSGATLVYAVLVQAPPDTFAAAISLGFCPDLPLTKPFCKGSGLEFEPDPKGKAYNFLPARNLKNPWVAFQGLIDKVCNHEATENFTRQVNMGEIIKLEKVGHGFSSPKNWLPQFRKAFLDILSKQETKKSSVQVPAEVKDLPLVEVLPQQLKGDFLAVIISGDGGWAGIDRSIGEFLAQQGIGVVGFNSLKYFWKRRTPEEASSAFSRILNHYTGAWKKNKVLLIGYSLGADVIPFMMSRLKAEEQSLVQVIALLGLSRSVDFEFHITDWLGGESRSSVRVGPEVKKLKGKKILCFCGADESDSLCHDLSAELARTIILKGGHHFGGDYQEIVNIILKESRL